MKNYRSKVRPSSTRDYVQLIYISNLPICRPQASSLLIVRCESASEAALAEVVLDGPLLGGSGLCESDGATEWTSEGGVLELSNADT
jgi:hypothetical protein